MQTESDCVQLPHLLSSVLQGERRTCDSNHFYHFLQKIENETVFPLNAHAHPQTLSHLFTCYELECTVVSRISTEGFLDFVGCQVKQIQVILH